MSIEVHRDKGSRARSDLLADSLWIDLIPLRFYIRKNHFDP
jgi:hypothetical protein